MSEAQTRSHTIGDEIPYRRSTLQKRTGSLVFDRHLDEALTGEPEQSSTAVANRLTQGQTQAATQ